MTIHIPPFRGIVSSVYNSIVPPVTSPVQYGRTENYDAGTDGDYFVSSSGSNSNLGTIESPFLTIQHAVNVAKVAGGAKIIRVRGGINEASKVKYREIVTINNVNGVSTNIPFRLASYGTEIAEITGGYRVTGFTQCTIEDEVLVGENYANIYKVSINTNLINHNAYHALIMTENDVPLNLVQKRHDTSDLFVQDDYNTFYSSANGHTVDIGVDGNNYVTTITHSALLPNYTDVQLAQCSVAVHTSPNAVRILKVVSASGGVLNLEANNSSPEITGGDKYALLNIVKEISSGQWAYVDNGNGTITFYVWPQNAGNINNSIDIAARNNAIKLDSSQYVKIDGLYLSQCSDDSDLVSSPLQIEESENCTINDLKIYNYSSIQKGYGGIFKEGCNHIKIEKITLKNGQNCFGIFASGGGTAVGNRILNILVERASQAPVRVYGETLFAIVDVQAINCGVGAHANLFNFYVGCDRWLIMGYNPLTRSHGYGTNQRSSRGLVLHCKLPMALDGRGYDDQSGGGNGIAPVNPSNNYFINNFITHDPERVIPSAALRLGDTTDGTNWHVYNSVTPGITEKEVGTILNRKSNILTNGVTVDVSESLETNIFKLFYNPYTLDFDTFPNSLLKTKNGTSVENIIQTYEAWFPDINFRRDIDGNTWDPVNPGVGPWGGNWPLKVDAFGPLISSFSADVSGSSADCEISTNENGGEIFWVRLTSGATTPSAAQIFNGLDASNAAAGQSGNTSVLRASDGPINFTITGVAGSNYKICVVHRDRHNNYSNILTQDIDFAVYTPTWVTFNDTNYLSRTDVSNALSNTQSTTQSLLLVYTMRISSVENVSDASGILTTVPTTRAMIVDKSSGYRSRAKFERSVGDNTLIVDHLPGSGAADVEYICFVNIRPNGGAPISQMRQMKISDGTFTTNPADDSFPNTDFVTFQNITEIKIFNCTGQFERFMLWDNVDVDITSATIQQYFVNGGVLQDKNIAINALGMPLISMVGNALTTGINSGNGGNFTRL